MYAPYPLYQLIHRWTCRFLAYLGNCKQCYCEHCGAHIFSNNVFTFLDIDPRVELFDHVLALFLVFWETSIPFSTVTTPIYIPTNSVWGLPFFLHLHQHLLVMFFLIIGVRWYSLWFWFSFPWWLMMLSIFSCACWLSAFPLWKNAYLFLPSSFLTVFFFFLMSVVHTVCICGILILYWSYHLQIFSPTQ